MLNQLNELLFYSGHEGGTGAATGTRKQSSPDLSTSPTHATPATQPATSTKTRSGRTQSSNYYAIADKAHAQNALKLDAVCRSSSVQSEATDDCRCAR